MADIVYRQHLLELFYIFVRFEDTRDKMIFIVFDNNDIDADVTRRIDEMLIIYVQMTI